MREAIRLWVLLAIVVATALTISACQAFGAEQVPGRGILSDFSPMDLEIVREARNLGSMTPEIWPGFDFSHVPILLHGRSSELLIGHPSPPKEFAPLTLPGWTEPLYLTDRPLIPGLAAMSMPLEGTQILAVPAYQLYPIFYQKLREIQKLKTEVTIDFMIPIFIHEAFHGWQMTRNIRKMFYPVCNNYPEFSPWNNAMKDLEGKLLYEALSTPSRFRKRIEEFLLIRSERRSRLTPGDMEMENKAEYTEGLATYVGYRITEKTGNGYRPAIRESREFHGYRCPEVRNYLLQSLRFVSEGDRGNLSLPSYQLGLAEGLALDRLALQWKEEIWKDGVWLDELLAKSVGKKLDYGAATYDTASIKQRYDFQDILEKQETFCSRVWKEREGTYEEFLKKPGARVVVDLSAAPSGLSEMFISTDLVRLREGIFLIKSGIQLLEKGGTFRMRIRDIPTLYEPEKRRCTIVLPPDFPAQVRIVNEGKPCGNGNSSFVLKGKIELSYDGFSILASSLKWAKENNKIIIYPAAAAP
ncbi:MAG: hypothetical protein RDV48_23915 [Candidatus Eremiobacteraeota bacterium]|nr:hypothetical protein [Candidatus Eremiobacteraeota bacterium]